MQESPTARDEPPTHINFIRIKLSGILKKISQIQRIFTLSFILQIQASIWKLICNKKLKIIKKIEYFNIVPEKINLFQKRIKAICSENTNIIPDTVKAITQKYL